MENRLKEALSLQLTSNQTDLVISEVKVSQDGFNRLSYATVKGKHHGSSQEVFDFIDESAELSLEQTNDRYYFYGDVISCQITELHDSYCDYEMVIASPLYRLTQCCHYDYFYDYSLKKLFQLILARHDIHFIKFECGEIAHEFELQYQQSDFDLFSSLTVQYGLIYYFKKIDDINYLIISDSLPSPNNEITLVENEHHNMVHADNCAFNIRLSQQATVDTVLVRSENSNFGEVPFESMGKEHKTNHFTTMSYHELHEPFASYSHSETKQQALQFQKQLEWPQEVIYLSTPLMQAKMGDRVSLKNTRDPRLIGDYYIIDIERYSRRTLNKQGGIESSSHQNLVLLPLDKIFSPLHVFFETSQQSVMHHQYKMAKPPLMLGKISGDENVDCQSDGLYQATLSIENNKQTNPLRLMTCQTGISKELPYGLNFPLYGQTDVVIAMQNNCPQRLVILGAYYNDVQRNPCTSANPMQNKIHTHLGLGLLMDNRTNEIKLYNRDSNQFLRLSSTEADEHITLETKTGALNFYAEKSLIQSAENNLTLSADTIKKEVANDSYFESETYYLSAKNKFIMTAKMISIRTKRFEVIANSLTMNSKKVNTLFAGNNININAKKIKMVAKNKIHFHAKKEFNINIGSTIIGLNKVGCLTTNKQLQLHADNIVKHQVNLFNCGGNLDAFETNSEIESVLEFDDSQPDFSKRKMHVKGYGKAYETQRVFYQNYNHFTRKSGIAGSLISVDSLPGTLKDIIEQANGGFSSTAGNLHSMSQAQYGGWNFEKNLHLTYSADGVKATYKYIQPNGLVNEGTANLSNTSMERAKQLSSGFYRTTLRNSLTSSLKIGVPLAIAGDVLVCGLDTYYDASDSICSSPSKFGAHVALDIPKAIGSGVVGTVGGSLLASTLSTRAFAVMGAEAGVFAGPLGAAVGLVGGYFFGYLAAKSFDKLYLTVNAKDKLSNYIQGGI